MLILAQGKEAETGESRRRRGNGMCISIGMMILMLRKRTII
jgi:hypothetical protein